MGKTSICILSLFFYLLLSSVALGQSYSLDGRSSLELNLGLWRESKPASYVVMSYNRVFSGSQSGFLGGVSFFYWISENAAVSASVGVLSARAESRVVASPAGTTIVDQRASAVIPILVRMKYFLLQSDVDRKVRLFFTVGAGPFVGIEAENTMLSQESRSEMAMGMRLGGGIDFLLSRHWKLGVDLGYNVMADYSTPIGARKNYNGPDFSFGFGYIFSGGSQ